MNPIDPGAPFGQIHRACAPEHQHRHAVAPGIEDRHGGMLQADDVVRDGHHRAAGRLGIAMRDRHGDLFVAALDHLRLAIAAVVHDRVMQATKA